MLHRDSIVHHAMLIATPLRQEQAQLLWDELRQTNPHNRYDEKTVLDIDTARDIISWAQTPHTGNKYIILSFSSVTIPAQNALLKIIEEPQLGTHFILITANKESLLPTLLSRLIILEGDTTTHHKDLVITFLQTKQSERISLDGIQNLLTKIDEKGRKDREGVRLFILELAQEILRTTKDAKLTEKVLIAGNHIATPSASTKTILEYVSLLVPKNT